MQPFSWRGASKVADLIDSGLALSDIVDSYGRAVHENAEHFCSMHSQAKRVMIKEAMTNAYTLEIMRKNEEREIAVVE